MMRIIAISTVWALSMFGQYAGAAYLYTSDHWYFQILGAAAFLSHFVLLLMAAACVDE